jgi:hypothetical protein
MERLGAVGKNGNGLGVPLQILPRCFSIEHGQCRSHTRVDIQCPVNMTTKMLKIPKGTPLPKGEKYFTGLNKRGTLFRINGDCHEVRINIKTNTRDDRSRDLLQIIVWQPNLIPES